MPAHFTVFGASFVQETHGFNPAPRRKDGFAVWGFIIGSLLFAVTTVAGVTATTWAAYAAGH